jgi:S1-C subfamily serine protease
MTDRPPSRWPMASVLIASFVLSAMLVVLYVGPDLAVRWRILEDQAAANAAYLRREAELKAESAAAERNLADLDRRVQLVSLGFREVARKVAPVVVNISNEKEVPEGVRGRTFYDHETKRNYREQAEGSGLIVKPGLVLTNHHVVRDAQRLRVTFASGRWVTVLPEAVSSDADTDLAVVRLPPAGAVNEPDYSVTAEFADSDKDVQVGDWVLAAGSPFGLKQTVTAGIVSAKGRVELGILDQVELIQTDAPINPGNSGGPLFDQRGRVLGINVAIASVNGSNQGIGFAIPSNAAREVLEQLVEKGEVVRGFLGIRLQEVPPGLERRLGVEETGGVFVVDVGPDSPADQVGLRRGDLVVRYNGEPVGTVNAVSQLRWRIARTAPETVVPLEVLRGRKRLKLEVTIAKRPTRA